MSSHDDEPWIGYDLDGTLAYYDAWNGPKHIGKPIPKAIAHLKNKIENGYRIKIFTARVNHGLEAIQEIQKWCVINIGRELEITNEKDFLMRHLYDDRCSQVVENEGIFVEFQKRNGP